MKLSSEERKEKKREYNKRYRQNMTEEQKKRSREYNKSIYQNMTDEKKEVDSFNYFLGDLFFGGKELTLLHFQSRGNFFKGASCLTLN